MPSTAPKENSRWKVSASSPEWLSSFNAWQQHGGIPECYEVPPHPLHDNSVIEDINWLVYAHAFDWFNSNIAMELALRLVQENEE